LKPLVDKAILLSAGRAPAHGIGKGQTPGKRGIKRGSYGGIVRARILSNRHLDAKRIFEEFAGPANAGADATHPVMELSAFPLTVHRNER
jgi:hypothetical protein